MNRMGKEASLEGLEFDGETVLCRVCGDKASGFHYGVHACEGCKGFFRRSIQQKLQYRPCLKNQQCNIMRVNRNRCQYCRFKKCIAVGMSRDAVRFGRVPKSEKARIMKQMHKMKMQSPSTALTNVLQNEQEFVQAVMNAHRQTNEFMRDTVQNMRETAMQNSDYINCPAHMACPVNTNYISSSSDNNQDWEDLSDNFTPAIRSVVSFAQAIPGFTILSKDDQITLLKAGTFEVLLVRLALLFDPETNTMLFTCGKLYKRQPANVVGSAGFLLDSMFDFAERFNKLSLLEDEIALFSAVVLLSSDRPGLRNVDQVEKIQNKLTKALETLVMSNHPEDSCLFAKLIMKTTDLRTLNTLHSEKSIGQAAKGGEDKIETVTTEQHMEVEDAISDTSSVSHTMDLSPLSTPKPLETNQSLSNAGSIENVVPQQLPLKNTSQPQVVLQTPYGLFLREESSGLYGYFPDQPRQRCHTLDRDTVARPRIHKVDDGMRRRYTLDREYISKMVSKLSDRLEKRAAIRGDSMPPSISNSAASSPIPEEHQQYLNNKDFVSISSTTVDSSTSSSRGSPMPDKDLLLPYSSSPSSPHPRPRSDSAETDDLTAARPRCYSFHMNSDGHASKASRSQQLTELDRLSADNRQNLLVPDMRRRSVGASFGLYARKASLLVDIHPSDLSRTADHLLKSGEETSQSSTDLSETRYTLNDAATISVGTHCPVENKIDAEQIPEAYVSFERRSASRPLMTKQDIQPSVNYDTWKTSQGSVTDYQAVESKLQVNDANPGATVNNSSELEIFPHKKFDKFRKYIQHSSTSSTSTSNSSSSPSLALYLEDGSVYKNDKCDEKRDMIKGHKSRLSAGEAHPQLLAQLQATNPALQQQQRYSIPAFSVVPSSTNASQALPASTNPTTSINLGAMTAGPVPTNVQICTNGTVFSTLPNSLNNACTSEEQKRLSDPNNGFRYQVHAAAVSHLKDKILKRMDSLDNIPKTCIQEGETYTASEAQTFHVQQPANPVSQVAPAQHSTPALGTMYSGMLPHHYPTFRTPYPTIQHVGIMPGYGQQFPAIHHMNVSRNSIMTDSLTKHEGEPLNLTINSAAAVKNFSNNHKTLQKKT